MRDRRRALAALVMLLVPAAAAADPNPLVGRWVHVDYSPQGKPLASIYAAFDEAGRFALGVPFVTATSSMIEYSGSYQMPDPRHYTAVLTDYNPKQNCEAVCLPIPAMMTLNQPYTCAFEPMSDLIVMIDCGRGPERYSRVP